MAGPGAHSSLGPSSSHRWLTCPGSVARTLGVVNRDTPASLRGTRGHELVELALRWRYAEDREGRWDVLVDDLRAWGRDHPDATDFVELCGLAEKCYWSVAACVDSLPDDRQVLIEQRVEVPGTEGHVFGTADVIAYSRTAGVVCVLDHKFGVQRVAVNDNPQLKLYGLGALALVDPEAEWVREVRTSIQQPAYEPVQHTATYTTKEMLRFGGWVSAKVEAALDPAAPVRPGEAQCRWCPVRDSCPEHLDWRIRDWFGSSGLEPAPPSPGLDELDLRRHLEARDRAARYVRAVDEAARANADHLPSGWEARTTRRTRVCKPAVLADRLTRAGYEPLETRVKSLSRLRREVGPGLDLLAGDALEVTESISVRACAEG